jgi:hypothetical protein
LGRIWVQRTSINDIMNIMDTGTVSLAVIKDITDITFITNITGVKLDRDIIYIRNIVNSKSSWASRTS